MLYRDDCGYMKLTNPQAGQSRTLMRSCLVILDSVSQIMKPNREASLVVPSERVV